VLKGNLTLFAVGEPLVVLLYILYRIDKYCAELFEQFLEFPYLIHGCRHYLTFEITADDTGCHIHGFGQTWKDQFVE